jgi:hypothetical protein
MAYITGDTRQCHIAQARDPRVFDLSRHNAGRSMATFALPGDFMSNSLDRFVQLALVDRICKSEGMN